MQISIGQQRLLRWIGWFFCINVLLVLLVELTYLRFLPALQVVHGATAGHIFLAHCFLAVSYLAHTTIICLACLLIPGIAIFCYSKRWLVMGLSLLAMIVLLLVLIIDNVVYTLFHGHQLAVGLAVLKSGQLGEEIPLSFWEFLALTGVIVFVIAVESVIAWGIWRYLAKYQRLARFWPRLIAGTMVLSIVASFSVMAFVVSVPPRWRFDASTSHLLLKMGRLVPYYQSLYGVFLPIADSSQQFLQPSNQPLHYPLHPMRCRLPAQPKPFNIVFLVIDTLRYDAVTPTVMPNLSRFRKKTIQFDHAWSGGNCTRPGIFSLFYGIPANYWPAMLAQRRGPVLIRALQHAGYEMGIFASATLHFPQFARSVFADVPHLRVNTAGDTSVARDEGITQAFKHFLATRHPDRPFFGFLFYDAVHNYCEGSSSEHQNPFHPAVAACARFSLTAKTNPKPYVNRYHNAAHFDDAQAGKVLALLQAKGLLKNTIVIITADHGEQFDDEHMGYWSHASAYTPYQLHIPLLVYWPGKRPQHRQYFVTNHDVVPTLMQTVLACRNPLQDYTTGYSLFSNQPRPFFVAGSYTDYAVVTPTLVTRIYPNGDYTMAGAKGHHLSRVPLPTATLKSAAIQLKRYF